MVLINGMIDISAANDPTSPYIHGVLINIPNMMPAVGIPGSVRRQVLGTNMNALAGQLATRYASGAAHQITATGDVATELPLGVVNEFLVALDRQVGIMGVGETDVHIGRLANLRPRDRMTWLSPAEDTAISTALAGVVPITAAGTLVVAGNPLAQQHHRITRGDTGRTLDEAGLGTGEGGWRAWNDARNGLLLVAGQRDGAGQRIQLVVMQPELLGPLEQHLTGAVTGGTSVSYRDTNIFEVVCPTTNDARYLLATLHTPASATLLPLPPQARAVLLNFTIGQKCYHDVLQGLGEERGGLRGRIGRGISARQDNRAAGQHAREVARYERAEARRDTAGERAEERDRLGEAARDQAHGWDLRLGDLQERDAEAAQRRFNERHGQREVHDAAERGRQTARAAAAEVSDRLWRAHETELERISSGADFGQRIPGGMGRNSAIDSYAVDLIEDPRGGDEPEEDRFRIRIGVKGGADPRWVAGYIESIPLLGAQTNVGMDGVVEVEGVARGAGGGRRATAYAGYDSALDGAGVQDVLSALRDAPNVREQISPESAAAGIALANPPPEPPEQQGPLAGLRARIFRGR